jgi:hypothetical protein
VTLKILPSLPVPRSTVPSGSTTELQTPFASVIGVLPRVTPARTLPLESTATPVRSPPFRSSSVSSRKVRVPTAFAGAASEATAARARTEARRAGFMEALT